MVMRSVTVAVKDLRLLRINLNYLKRQKPNKCGKKVCGHNSKILTLITHPSKHRHHQANSDQLVKDTKKRVYIENTAKKDLLQNGKKQWTSHYLSLGGRGRILGEITWFSGGVERGGNQSSLTESLGGDYGKLTN